MTILLFNTFDFRPEFMFHTGGHSYSTEHKYVGDFGIFDTVKLGVISKPLHDHLLRHNASHHRQQKAERRRSGAF
jgi:hypothetical protein